MLQRACDEEQGKTVLILAPHPDDEVLATGGIIQQHLAQGNTIKVALMTSGDGQRLGVFSHRVFTQLGERRFEESLKALSTLGLKGRHVYRLGYPDRGLGQLWSDFWDGERPFRSPYTRADRVPYKNALSFGAPFCGLSLLEDLKRLIRKLRPDEIYLPHPNDLHSDHWATHAFGIYALEQLKASGCPMTHLSDQRLHTYVIHRHYWPLPRGKNLGRPLRPSRSLRALDTQWLTIELKPAQTQRKYEAIQTYETQMKFMDDHLINFARRNELFGHVPTLHLNDVLRMPSPPQEKLPRWSSTNEPVQTYLAYPDSNSRGLWARLRKYDEIRSMHLRRDHDRLFCEIRFATRVHARSEVRLHVKTVGRDPQTLTMSMKQGQLCVNHRGADDRFSFVRHERSVYAQLPAEVFKDARRIVLGADVRRKGKLVGKSAYRLIVLQ